MLTCKLTHILTSECGTVNLKLICFPNPCEGNSGSAADKAVLTSFTASVNWQKIFYVSTLASLFLFI